MTDPTDTEFVVGLWTEALQAAYLVTKGERLAELRTHRPKMLDGRGIHQFSESWGVITTCENLWPILAFEGIATTPWVMAKQARADALDEFRAECVELAEAA